MTALYPCTICVARPTCQIRKDKKAALAGLGFAGARFNCDVFNEMYRPGRRVRVLLHNVAGDGGSDGSEFHAARVTATILERNGRKALVFLDRDELAGLTNLRNERGFCAVSNSRITFLDEPDAPEAVAQARELDRHANQPDVDQFA